MVRLRPTIKTTSRAREANPNLPVRVHRGTTRKAVLIKLANKQCSTEPTPERPVREATPESEFSNSSDDESTSSTNSTTTINTSNASKSSGGHHPFGIRDHGALARAWAVVRPPRSRFITIVDGYQNLIGIRDRQTDRWIYRKCRDGTRPLILYWHGPRLVRLWDRASLQWIYEDSRFLRDLQNNPTLEQDLTQIFQSQQRNMLVDHAVGVLFRTPLQG